MMKPARSEFNRRRRTFSPSPRVNPAALTQIEHLLAAGRDDALLRLTKRIAGQHGQMA
ncbi:MAG: hypothetical protein K8S22_00775 [Betaproteobacteria bacterium]|nr:hypothetical protein [Betaproteobacteria bacterium]